MDIFDNSKGIYNKLLEYAKSDYYPFHMPGHKRRKMNFVNPYEIDITEIEGFDDLHHPEGLLAIAQEEAATIYQSEASFFLVNGSTAGILAAISASVKKNGRLLMAKNCHKSAYHATYLREIKTEYLLPTWLEEWSCFGEITPKTIKEGLIQYPDTQAVMIVSPTYEGIVSDIEAIAKICHKHDVTLIVDEAHGAHFNFATKAPASALQLGADIVIQSLHKTLPSFTQTAILHIGSQRVNLARIQFFLDIFQTSSPSYIFLAGIQECIRFMNGEGQEQLEKYWLQLVKVRKQISNLKHINLLSMEETSLFNLDISKIVIGTGNTRWNARELYDKLLYEYHLQAEMCTENHVILMTTLNDSEEGLKRLVCALQEIDSWLSDYKFEPQKRETTKIQLKHCINKINMRYIYVYPPGIPILIPGERVTQESINTIKKYLDAGIKVHGLTKDGSILCQ